MRQVLVVIGGLPAVGKSTIATLLGSETSTPYLRVDRIEHAIVESSALSHPLGPAGYAVAHALVATGRSSRVDEQHVVVGGRGEDTKSRRENAELNPHGHSGTILRP